jgi:hypothetical protein
MTGPTRFIKKPIEVMAIRYTGFNDRDVIEFTDGEASIVTVRDDDEVMTRLVLQPQRFGSYSEAGPLNPGDWIVRDTPPRFRLLTEDAFVREFEPFNDVNSEQHVIRFGLEGWTLKHPLSCRRRELFDCAVNAAVQSEMNTLDRPPVPPGDYIVTDIETRPITYEPIPPPEKYLTGLVPDYSDGISEGAEG